MVVAVLFAGTYGWMAFELPVGWQIGTHHADFLLGIFRALGDFSAGIIVYRLYQKRIASALAVDSTRIPLRRMVCYLARCP